MIILRNYGLNQGQVLASTYPELAEQWDYDKNGALTPWDVTIGSKIKVWWKCSLGHEWHVTVVSRTEHSNGCPYCGGKKAWPGFNDLATLRPDLAAEWNTGKNGLLTPQMVVPGSCKKVWWKCSLGHEWEAAICSRTTHSSGCPYCAGLYAWPGFNDLASQRPDVAADWDYNLNGTDLPVQYTVYSSKKVWWVCRKGHPSYLMRIYSKSFGRGCPGCRPERNSAAHSKKVFFYAPDGRLQGAYPSIQAAARETGRNRATVWALSTGKRQSRYGYLYRYADQQTEKESSSSVEGRLRDCLSQPVSVGDPVMFIRAKENKKAVLIRGKVSGITKHSAYIQPENGSGSRLFVSGDDPEFLPKALVLHRRPERALEGALDASGYPVREGDPVVYILPHVYRDCRQFLYGIAVQADDSSWEIDGVKMPTGNMVVVNWE